MTETASQDTSRPLDEGGPSQRIAAQREQSGVLGISLVGAEAGCVVADESGAVIASNLADFDGLSADSAEALVAELVDSVPLEVNKVIVACAAPELRDDLRAAFEPTADSPDWYRTVDIEDSGPALAAVARAEVAAGVVAGGVLAVVALDADAVPATGNSAIITDTTTGEVLGLTDFPGLDTPVAETSGASELVATIRAIPAGTDIGGLIFVGSGAEVDNVGPRVAGALRGPVVIAEGAPLAVAAGLAQAGATAARDAAATAPAVVTTAPLVVAAPTKSGGDRRRWVLAGIAALLIFGLGALLGALLSGGTPEASAPEDAATVTSTITEEAAAATVTESVPAEEGAALQTVTQVVTQYPQGNTQTVTETEQITQEAPTVTVTVPVPQIEGDGASN